MIGLAVRLPTLRQIADETLHTDLSGGLLESVGTLFKRSVKVYVYPTVDAAGTLLTFDASPPPEHWTHLRDLLLEMGSIEPMRGFDASLLSIHTPDVLSRIRRGDPSWEEMVPPAVAEIIRKKERFGFAPRRSGP